MKESDFINHHYLDVTGINRRHESFDTSPSEIATCPIIYACGIFRNYLSSGKNHFISEFTCFMLSDSIGCTYYIQKSARSPDNEEQEVA